MLDPRSKAKGQSPPPLFDAVEDLNPEELEGFSVEDLLKGPSLVGEHASDLEDEARVFESQAYAPVAPPAAANPSVLRPARDAAIPGWGQHQAPPPREYIGRAQAASGPVGAGGIALHDSGPRQGGQDNRPYSEYRAQLDLMRHEVAQILNRQFEDIDSRFSGILSELHSRLELAEKTLRMTEHALNKRDEEVAHLRRENTLMRRKLKDLADVRQKLDEVFGG